MAKKKTGSKKTRSKKRRRLPQVVPRVVLSAAMTATTPVLAVACGDDDRPRNVDSGFSVFAPLDADFSVADAGFSVADAGFSVFAPPDDAGFSVADAGFSVADAGFSVFAPIDASFSVAVPPPDASS